MFKLMLDISKVVVIQSKYSSDTVNIYCKKPDASWPFEEDGLVLQFHAAKMAGVHYVHEHFGIPIANIEVVPA